MPKRLGFFTRLLDQGSAQRATGWRPNRSATRSGLGLDSAWIAQHHFHEQEGGLPSPLVFSPTSRRRPTGSASVQRIITLPMENRCASPKTQRYWIYSPTDVWRWVLAPAARQPRFCPSA